MLGQAHPFCRKTVDIRRPETCLPETARIPVTEIVSKDENDVGRDILFPGGTGCHDKCQAHE
jgi:hypothetical protein